VYSFSPFRNQSDHSARLSVLRGLLMTTSIGWKRLV
jgi:hypothetical protein